MARNLGYVSTPNENDARLPTPFPQYHYIAGRRGVGSCCIASIIICENSKRSTGGESAQRAAVFFIFPTLKQPKV